jgi:hypothetical protein
MAEPALENPEEEENLWEPEVINGEGKGDGVPAGQLREAEEAPAGNKDSSPLGYLPGGGQSTDRKKGHLKDVSSDNGGSAAEKEESEQLEMH